MLTNPSSLLSKPSSPRFVKKSPLNERTSFFVWRSGRDSNSRPHAWQACILTKLNYRTNPCFQLVLFFLESGCKSTNIFQTGKIFFRFFFKFYYNRLFISADSFEKFFCCRQNLLYKTPVTNPFFVIFGVKFFVVCKRLILNINSVSSPTEVRINSVPTPTTVGDDTVKIRRRVAPEPWSEEWGEQKKNGSKFLWLRFLPRVGGGARTHDLQIHNLAL